MSPSLLELPTELVEHVVRSLPAATDVSAFRLACRALRDGASHPFRQAYFVRRTVTLQVASLQRLFAITQHRDYGPALQDLVVRAEHFDPHHSYDVLEQHGASDGQRRRAVSRIELFARMQRDYKHLRHFRLGERLLLSVFRNITKLRSLTLQYAEYDDDRQKPMRFEPFLIDRDRLEVATEAFSMVMAAVASAPLSVDSLQLYKRHWGGAVTLHGLHLRRYAEEGLRQALSGVQHLRLSVSTRVGSFVPPRDHEVLARPAQFLGLLPNLRELELSLWVESAGVQCLSMPETRDVFCYISRVMLPRLVKCRLARMDFHEQDLKQFLACSRSTLRHLELTHVYIRDGSWASLLTHLAEELSLESLHLKLVFEDVSRLRSRLRYYGYTASLEGDGVKRKIMDFAETCHVDESSALEGDDDWLWGLWSLDL